MFFSDMIDDRWVRIDQMSVKGVTQSHSNSVYRYNRLIQSVIKSDELYSKEVEASLPSIPNGAFSGKLGDLIENRYQDYWNLSEALYHHSIIVRDATPDRFTDYFLLASEHKSYVSEIILLLFDVSAQENDLTGLEIFELDEYDPNNRSTIVDTITAINRTSLGYVRFGALSRYYMRISYHVQVMKAGYLKILDFVPTDLRKEAMRSWSKLAVDSLATIGKVERRNEELLREAFLAREKKRNSN